MRLRTEMPLITDIFNRNNYDKHSLEKMTNPTKNTMAEPWLNRVFWGMVILPYGSTMVNHG